jgi:cytoskeletal protein RodZ
MKQAAGGGSRGPVGAKAGLGVSLRRGCRPRGSVRMCAGAPGGLCVVLLCGALFLVTSVIAASALAAPGPDPYRANTTKPEPVAPDPYPAGGSAPKTTSAAPAPDPSAAPSASYTPPSVSASPIAAEPSSTASTPKKKPSATKLHMSHGPAKAASANRTQKPRTHTASPAPAVEKRKPSTKPNAAAAVGALAASKSGRPLASTGLALLALALASGGLLLLLGSETWRARS